MQKQFVLWAIWTCLTMIIGESVQAQQPNRNIITNPLNISYRFQTDGVYRRETADPVIVLYDDKYYLFASHSSGYWYSDDLKEWTYVRTATLKAVEVWAPAVFVYKGAIYYVGMGEERAFRSTNPMNDEWEEIKFDFHGMGDPALFQDEDGRVYVYSGCSDWAPIKGAEVDPENNFKIIGSEVDLIPRNSESFGWEVFGDNNEQYDKKGWNEAPCITRQGDYYYLMYAAPGTEFTSYCTGVYVSKNPLGPYTCTQGSPFAIKGGGFIKGAGHGHPFKDRYGNDWYVATLVMASKEHYERRVGIFPACYQDGYAYAQTAYMDFPFALPDKKVDFSKQSILVDMNLLSYGKEMKASSSLSQHTPEKASDEDVRTWWSASSGNKGEWLQMDLKKEMEIEALQISFSDDGFKSRRSDKQIPAYQYLVEYSSDNVNWKVLADRSQNTKDQIYELIVLTKKTKARYIRVRNMKTFAVGNFSIADIRLFGNGKGKKPSKVANFTAERQNDRRRIKFTWNRQENTEGYVIRWGTSQDRMNHSVMVFENQAEFGWFDKNKTYWMNIEAFNESGRSRQSQAIEIK